LGIAYVSLLYAPVVPAGLTGGGPLAIVATFLVGLVLSLVTARTGSLLSAAVAHASLAVGLFVVGPYWMSPGLGATGGPTSAPSVFETRPPATKPITVISGSPNLVPAPAGGGTLPGQAGQPSAQAHPGQTPPPTLSPALAGRTPPGAPATSVSLASPLPAPPTQPGPTSAPEGSPSQVASANQQIVVVRGTGGSGARLRSQPGNAGPTITVVPEYTPLVVIGVDRQADGLVWRNVRTPNGTEGWVAASFVTAGQ
jgi:hypothetical protein